MSVLHFRATVCYAWPCLLRFTRYLFAPALSPRSGVASTWIIPGHGPFPGPTGPPCERAGSLRFGSTPHVSAWGSLQLEDRTQLGGAPVGCFHPAQSVTPRQHLRRPFRALAHFGETPFVCGRDPRRDSVCALPAGPRACHMGNSVPVRAVGGLNINSCKGLRPLSTCPTRRVPSSVRAPCPESGHISVMTDSLGLAADPSTAGAAATPGRRARRGRSVRAVWHCRSRASWTSRAAETRAS